MEASKMCYVKIHQLKLPFTLCAGKWGCMPRLHSAGYWCSGSCEDKLVFCEVFSCSCQGGVWPFGTWNVWYGKLSFFCL